MPHVDLAPIRGIADALNELLPLRGFWREPPWPTTVEGDASPHGIACSWKRSLDIHPADPGGDALLSSCGNCDGISIWLDGYVNVGVAGTAARFEWRRTPLRPRAFAQGVDAYVAVLDDHAPYGIIKRD